MKIATVADLKKHFSKVVRGIQNGEAVTITKRGIPFAMLTRVQSEKTPPPIDWQGRLSRAFPGGAVKGDVREVIDYDRGET